MRTMSYLRKWGLFVMLFACCAASGRAQQRVNALFVGNSYTSANNLPQIECPAGTVTRKIIVCP